MTGGGADVARIEAAYRRRVTLRFIFAFGVVLIVSATMLAFLHVDSRRVPPRAQTLGIALLACGLAAEVAWFIAAGKRRYFQEARASPVWSMSWHEQRVARAAVRRNEIPSGADPAQVWAMAEAMRLGRWQSSLAIGPLLVVIGQALMSTFAFLEYVAGGTAVMFVVGAFFSLRGVAAADRFLAVDRGRGLRHDLAEHDGTLRKEWAGTELGRYRHCDSTYCFFEEESLPPLPDLDGTFDWLPRTVSPDLDYVERPRKPVWLPADSELPSSYVYFLCRPELLAAIPTSTACYWSPAAPVDSPTGGRLVRFLSDQLDVLQWYLWLPPDGGHRVVCGALRYTEKVIPPQLAARDLAEVAPSFEAFMYRFWVENLSWYELDVDEDQQYPAVRAYLAGLQAAAME
jgi:hypothetical protein